jgi:hypothetical protein
MLRSEAPACHSQLYEPQTNFQVITNIQTGGKTHRLLLELLVSQNQDDYRVLN